MTQDWEYVERRPTALAPYFEHGFHNLDCSAFRLAEALMDGAYEVTTVVATEESAKLTARFAWQVIGPQLRMMDHFRAIETDFRPWE